MSVLALLGGDPVIGAELPRYKSIGDRERSAVSAVMESGLLSGFLGSPGLGFNGGPKVQEFEAEWCDIFDVRHAVSVNSATSGLQVALGATGIGPGDEVIVPPYTMSATVVAPLIWGGVPVFADIEPETFCLDIEKVRAAICARTKVIVAVNLFGHPARLAELRNLADEQGIWLVEDNSQAPTATEHGRLCGTIGHIGVYSLNVHKHIHAGEGGVCVTSDSTLATKMSAIRNHGENAAEELGLATTPNIIGFNFRLPELSAAIALEQLRAIKEHVGRREAGAKVLSDGTGDLLGWTPPPVRDGCSHNYYMWTARYEADSHRISRQAVSDALTAEGFPNEVGYTAPLYRLPLFQARSGIGVQGYPFNLSDREYTGLLCPVAEQMYCQEVIQFQPPAWDVDRVLAEKLACAVRKVIENIGDLGVYDEGIMRGMDV